MFFTTLARAAIRGAARTGTEEQIQSRNPSHLRNRLMTPVKRKKQIHASDVLMLVAVAGTILGGLLTLLA
jgi:hypothetical protein